MRATLGAVLACIALAGLLPAVASADVPPGFDLFETDPEATVFSFREEFTIPPNFFDQGSEPFQGDVNFGGVPLNRFNNRDVGSADTVVRRPEAANVTGPGTEARIPIELVALSLQSVAPIEVNVRDTQQLWDVTAAPSPSRPSRGEMRIVQSAENGGAFDSQLQVFPRFVFTRLSDGATRTLDTGQLPPQQAQSLILQADFVPWRKQCVLPALNVPGVNDGFCPGLTPGGQKQLTVEQARLARHGVYPVQPRLEHFGCYNVRPQAPFRQRAVTLRDQFGALTARVIRPTGLCAPARKNREPFVNRANHLKCYVLQLTARFQSRTVRIRNQFGPDRLRVIRPQELCVPSLKRVVPRSGPPPPLTGEDPTLRTSHFLCYSATGTRRPARDATFADQFVSGPLRIQRPTSLCTPVQKNNEPFRHPVYHLVCYAYEFRRGTRVFRPRLVRTRNQFGRETLNVLGPRPVCVPTLKIRA